MFTNTDNPITNSDDDELGFESLAKRISTSIISSNIDTTDSFTISIEGKWGSGKTSLVNLIKKDIKEKEKEKEKEKVIIMEFNPWIVNDFEQLIKYFFSELTKELVYQSTWTEGAKKDDIIKDFKKLARIILPDNVRIGTKALSATYNKQKEKEETVLELKSKINDYLKYLKKKIVIIVDDIDRLTDKETETFFRLIKGIADFNNIIYILLYDKAIVAKSLEKFKQENGERYLDKIVQYSLSIPKVYSSKLNSMLRKKIDKILEENPKHYFNEDKWDRLLPSLDKYITNIRDINKVMNVISFEYPQIAEDVNFFDFFILSLIKVQNYELYEELKYNKHQFHREKFDRWSDDYEKEKEKLIVYLKDELTNFKKYQPLLEFLIPNLDPYRSFYTHKEHEDKSAVYEEYFDNYFTFSVAKKKISQQEYYEIIEKLSIKESFNTSNLVANIYLLLKIKENENFFINKFKEQTLDTLSVDKITNNILINLLFIPYSEYLMINFCIEVFKKIKNIDAILKLIYLEENSISLKTKLEFYRDIKDEDNNIKSSLFSDIDKKLIFEVEALSLQDLLIMDKNDKFDFQYFQWIVKFFPSLSNKSLEQEIPNLILKSKKEFFELLNLFLIQDRGKTVFDKKYLTEYIDIMEVDKYIESLDKKELKSNESLLVEFWNIK